MGNSQEKEKDVLIQEQNIENTQNINLIQKEIIEEKNLKEEGNQKFNSLDEEMNHLLEVKKNNLIYQLYKVKEELKKRKSIYDLEDIDFEKEDKSSNNKDIDIIGKKKNFCGWEYTKYLSFNFNFLGILFVIFNLVGIYQLIGLLNSTQKEMIFGIKSFLFEKNRTSIFNYTNSSIDYIENHFENYTFKNLPNFNLLSLTSILGNLCIKMMGFIISTFIFMAVNSIILLLYISFQFPPEKYDNFYQLLLLILYFVLLLITVGSISLMSQQIYFDGLRKYLNLKENQFIYIINPNDNEKEKESKNKQEKMTFFQYICFTQIPAYLIYFGINFFLMKKNYYGNLFLMNIIVYVSSTIISLAIYFFYSLVFIKGDENSNKKSKKKISRICGYVIYSETNMLSMEKKDDNDKNNNNDEIILTNNSINNKRNELKNNKKDKEESVSCVSIKLGCRKFYHYASNSPVLEFCLCKCYLSYCCCCCCCNFCEYCNNNDINEFSQDDEQFCYCYKVQRKVSWFCDLLFKNNILEIIIINILLEMSTIGFEKQINQNFENNELNINFFIIIAYISFFLMFSILNNFFCLNKDINTNKTIKNKKDEEEENSFYSILQFGKNVGNLSGITISNIFFVTIFSGFSYFGNETLKNFTNKYLILFPLGLTKFFYFILINSLVNIVDYHNIDLLSNSTIISLFFFIYKMIAIIITDILDLNADTLICFQFIMGMIFWGNIIALLTFAGLCLLILQLICCCIKKNKKKS